MLATENVTTSKKMNIVCHDVFFFFCFVVQLSDEEALMLRM